MGFYKVKFAVSEAEMLINENIIRAILPSKEENKYFIWLDEGLTFTPEVANRTAVLGDVVPLEKDFWEVTSTDLGKLFDIT